MERVKGIEPSCAAWKAAVLPLNYTRYVIPLILRESWFMRDTRYVIPLISRESCIMRDSRYRSVILARPTMLINSWRKSLEIIFP